MNCYFITKKQDSTFECLSDTACRSLAAAGKCRSAHATGSSSKVLGIGKLLYMIFEGIVEEGNIQ